MSQERQEKSSQSNRPELDRGTDLTLGFKDTLCLINKIMNIFIRNLAASVHDILFHDHDCTIDIAEVWNMQIITLINIIYY